jgi:pimeloyl-ACP methyl ester carboxylesterase
VAGTGGVDGNQGAEGTDPLPTLPLDQALPIVFVHGFAGSAQQYESQAMRFVANGYPPERIRAYDHDGAGFDTASFVSGLTAVVDGVLAEFGTSKVFLVGHSRGTFVSSMFLSNPARAAKVEKYIAIDGSACPASFPCIAPNQAMFPGQTHVEVCTSKESFAVQYEFLMGAPPQVVDIVRQRAPVEISGRAVNFPANTGREGTMLAIYPLEAATGARAQPDPIGTFQIGADGNWGPVVVDPETLYEMELTAPSGSATHFYSQPFLRSTNFVRLLSGPPDADTRVNTNTSDTHAALVVSRQREWLAADVLEVSTPSPSGDQPAVNALTSAAAAAMGIALHIHDAAASPGDSTLDALPYFSSQPFQYGVDIFMPATEPPNGVITLRNLPRGDAAKPQVLNVPNWQSSNHIMSIAFSDFPRD